MMRVDLYIPTSSEAGLGFSYSSLADFRRKLVLKFGGYFNRGHQTGERLLADGFVEAVSHWHLSVRCNAAEVEELEDMVTNFTRGEMYMEVSLSNVKLVKPVKPATVPFRLSDELRDYYTKDVPVAPKGPSSPPAGLCAPSVSENPPELLSFLRGQPIYGHPTLDGSPAPAKLPAGLCAPSTKTAVPTGDGEVLWSGPDGEDSKEYGGELPSWFVSNLKDMGFSVKVYRHKGTVATVVQRIKK